MVVIQAELDRRSWILIMRLLRAKRTVESVCYMPQEANQVLQSLLEQLRMDESDIDRFGPTPEQFKEQRKQKP